jgi:hypothetical protein
MALDDNAKREFIEGMVEDFKRQLEGNEIDPKVLIGQVTWAAGLCDRIITLIQNGEVTFNLDGTGTQTRKVK